MIIGYVVRRSLDEAKDDYAKGKLICHEKYEDAVDESNNGGQVFQVVVRPVEIYRGSNAQ